VIDKGTFFCYYARGSNDGRASVIFLRLPNPGGIIMMIQRGVLYACLLLLLGMVLTSCSSSPSVEELRQLAELKDQVSSLQREVSSKEQLKNNLDKEVADKNARLRKCNDDQQVVRQRLGR